MTPRLVVGAVVVAGVVAASAYPAESGRSLDGCVHAGRHTHIVSFRDAHAPRVYGTLRGAVIGTGARGVVLLNQSGSNLCSWLPFAHELARDGIRTIVFDYGYGGAEGGAVAAAAELRRHGVTRLVFLGSSLGTRGAVVGGAAGIRGTSGVVCLSFSVFSDQAERAARRLRVGVLLVTSRDDDFGAYDESKTLFGLLHVADKHLVVVPGDAHGLGLLAAAAIHATVVDWLSDHLG
jgi:predicted alpha/beta-hydrolase family hydrolase